MTANRRNYEEKLTAVKKRLNGELKDPIGLNFRYFILAAERILYYCDS
jgi:hypothetical protein